MDGIRRTNKGEQDVIILPEVIATQGCVAVKNLNNILNLAKVKNIELDPFISEIHLNTGRILTYPELKEMLLGSEKEEFEYGLGVKVDETPLQYLISSILETIFSRIGYQELGGTGVRYSLLSYHISPAMEGGWTGAAVNLTNVRDPKLDFLQNLKTTDNK